MSIQEELHARLIGEVCPITAGELTLAMHMVWRFIQQLDDKYTDNTLACHLQMTADLMFDQLETAKLTDTAASERLDEIT